MISPARPIGFSRTDEDIVLAETQERAESHWGGRKNALFGQLTPAEALKLTRHLKKLNC
jgi:hypothetical protein